MYELPLFNSMSWKWTPAISVLSNEKLQPFPSIFSSCSYLLKNDSKSLVITSFVSLPCLITTFSLCTWNLRDFSLSVVWIKLMPTVNWTFCSFSFFFVFFFHLLIQLILVWLCKDIILMINFYVYRLWFRNIGIYY